MLIITAPLLVFFTVERLPRVPLTLKIQQIMYTHIYKELKRFLSFTFTHDFHCSIFTSLSLFSLTHFIKHLTCTTLNSLFSFRTMSTTAFEFDGAKFVTNNYAAILDNDEAPKEFHLIQDFLAHSELMYALTQPESISPSQVLTFWRTARYDDGGDHGSPSLTCDYEGQEYFVSPATVRKALHLQPPLKL